MVLHFVTGQIKETHFLSQGPIYQIWMGSHIVKIIREKTDYLSFYTT